MKTITKLNPKQLNELKKSLHKSEMETAVKLLNDMNKILNNSSDLRDTIIQLEKDKEKLEKNISNLKHKLKVNDLIIDSRDSVIRSLKDKLKQIKSKE